MPQLSVCIEMFWAKTPPEEKVRLAGKLGCKAFEFWGWSNKDLSAVRNAADESGMAVACCGFEPNGCLVSRARRGEIVDAVGKNVQAARQLGTRTLVMTAGNIVADESFEVTRRRVVAVLREIAPRIQDAGLTLVLEPLNTLVDHAGHWLSRMSDAADIVDEVDSPAVKILMDLYHQQITEGNLIANLRRYADRIGHFHCAGVPGRHELVGGELDYRAIFKAIDEVGYQGYVGLEFRPTAGEDASLKQAQSLVVG